MPISSGFSQDPYPDASYYVRKPGKTEMLDEAIYYKRDEPFERPVEIIHRPIVKETIFMPDRRPPPLIHTRDTYVIIHRPIVKETIFMPDRRPPPLIHTRDTYVVSPQPEPIAYTTTSNVAPPRSFDLIPALGLNADCPCWSWICILLAFLVLLGLVGMCLYFILKRYDYI
ncbi:unnamed protein product [Adineta steineri]|uniref:Uncharacterized protein n=1 Tax=Adineta steineri TaxID=433720 RepID=A0A815PVN2_9BILA|nr:unnamed protein product [Adineta steineri]